jgi:hypothetical protein
MRLGNENVFNKYKWHVFAEEVARHKDTDYEKLTVASRKET